MSWKTKCTPFWIALTLLCLTTQAREQQVDRTSALSMRVYEKIQEIQTLADSNDLERAENLLNELLEGRLSDYERAQSLFLLGYIRYQDEDLSGALQAYEQAMQTGDTPLGLRINLLRTLSQLNMVKEDFSKALHYADLLLDSEPKPEADSRVLKAQILYQMKRMQEALKALDAGIQLYAQKNLPPRENWLLLKNAIYYERNDYRSMLSIIQQLVELYPRDRYLLNMSAIYGELGDSRKQLSLMEPLYERGSLNRPAEMVNLASLYMLHNIPYKAASLLEKEIGAGHLEASKRNLEMLARAWLLAGNPAKAIDPMSRAAELASDGKTHVELARILMGIQHWPQAEQALKMGIGKGGLHSKGDAQLMLGMTQFNQKKFRAARRSFATAGQNTKTESLARQWLAYLEQEEAQAQLAEGVAQWM